MDRLYACPICGSLEVELCFPVWVRANDLDKRSLWELDSEATPEKDSDRGWCEACSEHVLVKQIEVQGPRSFRGNRGMASPSGLPPKAGQHRRREAELERVCRGLLQDIGEVLERQGEEWWDETVTSGLHHRALAAEALGEPCP